MVFSEKRTVRLPLCFIPVFILFLCSVFAGCASSGGTLFTEMTEKDRQEAEEEGEDDSGEEKGSGDSGEEKGTPGISIESVPDKAEVYINGLYQGETPLTLEDIENGEYSLEVRKSGYISEKRWIQYSEGEFDEYTITLEEITGFLSVAFSPENARIFLDGRELDSSFEEVRAGKHLLTVKAFGFEPFEREIVIDRDETTAVEAFLEPAELEISRVRVSKQVFNPGNPGTLGSVTLRFEVSKEGSGSVSVFSPETVSAAVFELPPFTGWEQSITWDGRNSDGEPLPDGTYTFFIQAEDETVRVTEKFSVTIDSSRRVFYSSTLSGAGGLMYCPGTEVLPTWASQLGISFLGHIQDIEGTAYYRFPIQASLRISPFSNFELTAAAGLKLTSAPETPISVSVSGKYQFANWNIFRMAATVKGTFVSQDTEDTLTNFTGFSAGMPLQLVLGPFSFVAGPEFTISPERVVYLESKTFPVQSVYVWNYFRAGIALQWKRWGAAISAAIRMLPYTEGFRIHWPLPAGAELHFVIPGTQVVLLLQGAGEFSPRLGYYLLFGLGAALLN